MNCVCAALAIANLIACAPAWAAKAPAGPALRRDVAMLKVPLSSRWDQLSEEQHAEVKAS
jgi:hypothetical protein